MTGREMCEQISAEIERRTGKKIPPGDLWNMSPTGELWPVFELYNFLFNRWPTAATATEQTHDEIQHGSTP